MHVEDLTPVAAKASEIAYVTGSNRRVWGSVAQGTPRGRVLEQLREQLGGESAIVRFPPLDDADAPVNGLLQAAAHVGPNAVEQALADAVSLRDRARGIAQQIATLGRVLTLWIPPSWQAFAEVADPEAELRHRRAAEVLGGWLSENDLRVIVLCHPSSFQVVRDVNRETEWRKIAVDPPKLASGALDDPAAWGPYEQAVVALRDALGYRKVELETPSEARLLVALLGLDQSPGALLEELSSTPRRLQMLAQRLGEILGRRANQDVANGVVRFLRARLPLPREAARAIAKLPEEHVPLLEECLGQGGELLEADEIVRQKLLFKLVRGKVDPDTRLALADHHEKLDGARHPRDAWQSIENWLEKTHQLGLSGPRGAERWSQLDLPARELYWDRARSLSYDHHEYLAAAELYRQCIDRFDRNDAYSWHYLGYNLDRVGVDRKEAERAFRKAVELRGDHPWYNGRLVTFLIDQARFQDADKEWTDALDRTDPHGENISKQGWLAFEMHRWVVKAWLRFGEVRRARKVFDDIPEEMFAREGWFEELRNHLEDAEEALRLGESVYPPTTPMADRWKRPSAVPERDKEGRPLRSWFPGRIVSVDDDIINVVLAVPVDDSSRQRVIARPFTRAEWHRYGPWPAAEAEGWFIFLAVYANPLEREGAIQIFAQPQGPRRDENPEEITEQLRYLVRAHA